VTVPDSHPQDLPGVGRGAEMGPQFIPVTEASLETTPSSLYSHRWRNRGLCWQ
jgi:hypothetical protein